MKYEYGAKVENPSLYHLTYLGSNPGTSSKMPATSRVSHGTSPNSILILIFTSAQLFLLHKVICRLHASTNK